MVLFGCTKTTVKNSLALLECTAAVRNAVESGKITVTNAYDLSRLDAEEQRTTVEKMIAASEGEKGHKRSRKQREAAGKKVRPTAKQIEHYKTEIKDNCSDPAFRAVALAMLGWVLGGPQPRFPKAKADSKTEAA
jgi:ParB family chromosome partitioning protein